MIHHVIRKGAVINVFNVPVLKHFCESFGKVNFDSVFRVDPQGQQYRRSVLRLVALSVRYRLPPALVQGVHSHNVTGSHEGEACGQVHLQYISSIMSFLF